MAAIATEKPHLLLTDIGMPGGPLTPIDRRMRLAACPGGIQIDPPSLSSVTVRCTAAAGISRMSWRS